jgi:hypothetical protein
MKIIWQTTIRDVQSYAPVLSGRKVDGQEVFEYGPTVKKIVTTDNVAFQVEGDEDVPPKGSRLRITIETL